jgi:hypothetical protein
VDPNPPLRSDHLHARHVSLPYTYLGADDRAGPNYPNQPAVNAYDQPQASESGLSSRTRLRAHARADYTALGRSVEVVNAGRKFQTARTEVLGRARTVRRRGLLARHPEAVVTGSPSRTSLGGAQSPASRLDEDR